jgi:RNA-directed DNA polymerase
VPLKELTWWIWALDESKRYQRFEIARRSGGDPREINAPIKPIKDMQRTLAQHIAQIYRPRDHVHGFVEGRSIISNSSRHRRKTWVLRVDLWKFFNEINFGRVRGVFLKPPFDYSEEVATTLAQLCCHHNALPQGAPTSPIVSNLVCRKLDSELADLARKERCHVTRYADDITISTDRTVFPASVASWEGGRSTVGPQLGELIDENGFKLNEQKTTLTRYTQRQRVTGLVINEKLNVPRDYIRGLRSLLHIWEQYGRDDAEAAMLRARPRENWPPEKPAPDFENVVRGRVNYVGSVRGWDDPVYVQLAGRLEVLDEKYSPKYPPPLPVGAARLFTEGESDGIHLLAALAKFQAAGDFSQLQLEWEPLPGGDGTGAGEGDKQLLFHCEALARTPQAKACVCVFDRDTPQVLKKALDGGDWKDWTNGVVSVGLGPPGHLEVGSLFCIELLHPKVLLQRKDSEGRRLFTTDEFDPKTGFHLGGDPYIVPRRASTLIREDVYEFPSQKKVGLGKVSFARAVSNGNPPYEDADFEGFRPTFELITRALRAATEGIASST